MMDDLYEHHSVAQNRVLNTVFTGEPGRPNDRLRNAGPLNSIPVFGATLVAYDEDKHHHWQPTLEYHVERQWLETKFRTCRWGWISYPCNPYDEIVSERATFAANTELLEIENSKEAIGILYDELCELFASAGDCAAYSIDDIYAILTNFGPDIKMPYQFMTVYAPLLSSGHYWRFRTSNGLSCTQTCDDWNEGECSSCSAWTEFTAY